MKVKADLGFRPEVRVAVNQSIGKRLCSYVKMPKLAKLLAHSRYGHWRQVYAHMSAHFVHGLKCEMSRFGTYKHCVP